MLIENSSSLTIKLHRAFESFEVILNSSKRNASINELLHLDGNFATLYIRFFVYFCKANTSLSLTKQKKCNQDRSNITNFFIFSSKNNSVTSVKHFTIYSISLQLIPCDLCTKCSVVFFFKFLFLLSNILPPYYCHTTWRRFHLKREHN